ncbi:hypothetical protein CI109_107265 [Kwoniella shandongensis]|uniref:Uncharacterized protein n=1 Tax=Kwoniella shandongensis TaxID=1734106 RepID=A0A5M6C250_9TREE|nr:uncharacterized protein CI109_002547 [Kwoniella shandongensis]KAA5529206.1 hypothetical protein CI109_002547 [Kwoniella shandongensis]
MLPVHRRVSSLAGRKLFAVRLQSSSSSTPTSTKSEADRSTSFSPSTTQQTSLEAESSLTGSAKLFADAIAEESITASLTSSSSREHLRHTQGPVWTGDESTHDAVLRMLTDVSKPLRNDGGIKHNAADEKIKGWMKGLNLEPRLGVSPALTPREEGSQDISTASSTEKEESNPHRTTIPPHLHRPWHSTYTGEKQASTDTPQIKYGTFIRKSASGDSLSNILELQLPPGADGKTRARVKEARRAGKMVRRFDSAREGALDYRLGLGTEGGQLLEVGEEGEEGEQTFKGNRQIRGNSVLGAGKGNASGMRAWTGLVEDRIQRARDAGFFKITNGKGMPIPRDPEARNPHIETGELLMNRIVKRQGALPPWIELQNSLDATLTAFRSTLLSTYTNYLVRNVISTNALSPLPPLHSIPSQDEAWEARELKFHQENIKQINDLVRRMNAQAPSPARRNLLTLENELSKIRGDILRNEVWNEVKRRAEENAKINQNRSATNKIQPFIFDNEGWTALKSATRRSFGTIAAPVSAIIGKGRVGGAVESSRQQRASDGDNGGGQSSKSEGTHDPRPLRLVVMAGLGVGAIIYFRRRPVHNDSDVDFIPVRPPTKIHPSTPAHLVASSPTEQPLTFIRVIRLYIIEPIATLIRFFHLAILFGPVILTTPMLLVGKPEKRRKVGKPVAEEEENWGAVWWYGFLVKQMERAGPSFIKLGQWAASRADLFPTELCTKMSKLHSNGKPHSMAHTKRVMEKAFGLQFDGIFEEFDQDPIGCGAIAQVYKAKLKPEVLAGATIVGADEPRSYGHTEPHTASVAIKVIHPRIRQTIRRDIAIMSIFANCLNALPGMEWLSIPEEVAVFGEIMNSQLDLRVEASNLRTFEKNFNKRGRTVTFPQPMGLGKNTLGEEREERQDILIEEFEDALPLKYFLTNGGGPYDTKIATIGLDAFLEMLLLDNWTHGDLHPGNIMVRFYKPTTTDYLGPLLNRFSRKAQTPPSNTPPSSSVTTAEMVSSLSTLANDPEAWIARLEQIDSEGYQPQLIFIDAGLVTSLDDTNRRNFLDLFSAVATFDGYKAGKLMVERCRLPDHVIDEETFALKMQHIVLSVKSKTFSLAKIKISDILTDVLNAVRQHHVKLEGDFVNTVLSILLLEGIGRQLDPEMDLFKSALPILRQLGRQMGTREAINSTPKGSLFAMIKLWVWVEARSVAGEVSAIDEWMKYDRLTPSI